MLIYLSPIFLFIILILFLPINLRIDYKRKGQDDNFQLNIYTFIKILGISINIPYLQNKFRSSITQLFSEVDLFFLKIKSDKESTAVEKEIDWGNMEIEKIEKLLTLILDKTFIEIIISTLKIRCRRFFWKTEYGMSNPAYTGISNGFIWMLKGVLIKLTYDLLIFLCEPELNVKPDFYNEKFYTHFSGIFSAVLGNIILTLIKLLLYKLNALYIKRLFLSN